MRKDPVAGTHQIIVNAFVQFPLVVTALPHLLVVVLQAFPVGSELFKTVCVDILDTAPCHVSARGHILYPIPRIANRRSVAGLRASLRHSDHRLHVEIRERGFYKKLYAHAPRTSCHPPALLQTLDFALARVLGLALHEIIVIVLAPRANEEGRGHQRSRACAQLLDLGNRIW